MRIAFRETDYVKCEDNIHSIWVKASIRMPSNVSRITHFHSIFLVGKQASFCPLCFGVVHSFSRSFGLLSFSRVRNSGAEGELCLSWFWIGKEGLRSSCLSNYSMCLQMLVKHKQIEVDRKFIDGRDWNRGLHCNVNKSFVLIVLGLSSRLLLCRNSLIPFSLSKLFPTKRETQHNAFTAPQSRERLFKT